MPNSGSNVAKPPPSDEVSIPQRQVLSVSQLNRQARMTIEQRFNQIWVSGELSSFARPSSGHWYFTLKDNDAQVRCAMFANANRRARMQPANGQQVLLRGRVSLYEGRGEFQIIVEHMEPAGEGALRAAFDALKRQLDAEGLFDTARKRPLPALPKHVVVVTSPTGAALTDILSVWRRRFPALNVTLVPTAVQGADAEQDILEALARAQDLSPDVVLLTRGGGSMEDLWVFNAESIARSIAAIRIPVVSAVGHEIDVSIADFVADLRAPTPSAAAELIAPDGAELQQVLLGQLNRLGLVLRSDLQQRKLRLEKNTAGLVNPQRYCLQAAQRVDDLTARLTRSMDSHLATPAVALEETRKRLHAQRPDRLVVALGKRLGNTKLQLIHSAHRALEQKQNKLGAAARILESLSPLPTLARGYTVVRSASGTVLSSTTDLAAGHEILGQMQDGAFTATITDVQTGITLANANQNTSEDP